MRTDHVIPSSGGALDQGYEYGLKAQHTMRTTPCHTKRGGGQGRPGERQGSPVVPISRASANSSNSQPGTHSGHCSHGRGHGSHGTGHGSHDNGHGSHDSGHGGHYI